MTVLLRGGLQELPALDASLGDGKQLSQENGQLHDVARLSADNALYRFTDRLFRAQTLPDVCDAALDAISSSGLRARFDTDLR